MPLRAQRPAGLRPENLRVLIIGSAVVIGLTVGMLSVPLLILRESTPLLAPVISIGLAGTIILFFDTHLGICFAAFAIAPLGIVQREILSVTINLPELLILALTAKEAILFIARGEKLSGALPKRTLALYLAGAAIALYTGFSNGNKPNLVLQDFRQFIEYIALFLLVIHRVKTRRALLQVLGCFLAGMTIVGIHGILQRFTGIGIPMYQLMNDQIYHDGIRSGSFYGATPLGAMMVLAVGVGAALGLATNRLSIKAVTGLCIAIAMVSAVFTNTRASWIAIAFALAIIFVSIRKTPLLWSLAITGGLIFAIFLGPHVVQRMAKIEISVNERSLLERVRYYTAAWHIFRAQPFTGLGWGCEFHVKSIVQNGHYVPLPPLGRVMNKPIWKESTVHSAYLQLLVRTGLFGLIPFLIFLANWVIQVIKERYIPQKEPLDHNLFIGLNAALLGYLLHSSVENFFQWPVMSQSFWLLLGLSFVMLRQLQDTGALATAAPATAAPAAAPAVEAA